MNERHFILDLIFIKVANSEIPPVDFQSMTEVQSLLPHVVGGLLFFNEWGGGEGEIVTFRLFRMVGGGLVNLLDMKVRVQTQVDLGNSQCMRNLLSL
jgi:hypothetical protein